MPSWPIAAKLATRFWGNTRSPTQVQAADGKASSVEAWAAANCALGNVGNRRPGNRGGVRLRRKRLRVVNVVFGNVTSLSTKALTYVLEQNAHAVILTETHVTRDQLRSADGAAVNQRRLGKHKDLAVAPAEKSSGGGSHGGSCIGLNKELAGGFPSSYAKGALAVAPKADGDILEWGQWPTLRITRHIHNLGGGGWIK
jgi:hypothetical protein